MPTVTYLTDEQIAALSYKEVGEALETKRDSLAAVFKDRDVHEIPEEEAREIKNQNDELTKLAERYDVLSENDKARQAAINLKDYLARPETAMYFPQGGPAPKEQKDIDAGTLFLQSEAFKQAKNGNYGGAVNLPTSSMYPEFKAMEFADSTDPETKELLGTDDSLTNVTREYDVQNIRRPGIIGPVGERPLRVEDLFPSSGMAGNAIPYMVETVTNNAAAETEEGAAKPESHLAFAESSSPAQVVANWIAVTRQIFSDEPALRGYVNGRLRTFVDQRVDLQLLVGDGIAPNLEGILNVTGIQTQAKGADPVPDAVYKGMTKVRAAATGYFVEPDAYVTHPNDWQEVRLLRTADGIYIWGSPADAGPDRIWGLRTVQTTAITENTGLVGAFGVGAMIFNRWGLTLRVAEQHGTDFTSNKLTILAERRLAFPVFRPAAFCTVTGI